MTSTTRNVPTPRGFHNTSLGVEWRVKNLAPTLALQELKRGVWLKIKQEGQTAGFGPCFLLPGQPILGTGFLSHSHVTFVDSPLQNIERVLKLKK